MDTVEAQVRIFRYKSIDRDLSVCTAVRSIGGKFMVVVVNFVLKCQFYPYFPDPVCELKRHSRLI